MLGQKLFIAGLFIVGVNILLMLPSLIKYAKAYSNDNADGLSRAVKGIVVPGLFFSGEKVPISC